MYVERLTPEVERVVKSCFPDYNGKKIEICSADTAPKELNSYWDGGSKTSYAFYDLISGKVVAVESNHPFFERDRPRHLSKLPDGILLVAHSIFCGKDAGITIYAPAENLAKMLPPPAELSLLESVVLIATRSYKNTYGGETNLRYKEARRYFQITPPDWLNAVDNCISKGYLAKNGAITPKGRNALESAHGRWCDLFNLQQKTVKGESNG